MTDRPTHPSAAAPRPDAASRVRSEPPPLVLGQVVASLVRPTSHEVVVERRSTVDGSLLLDREEVTVRPVLAELRASLVPGGESDGSGRGGHVPFGVDCADVLRDLELLVRAGLITCRLRRRPTAGECLWCRTPVAYCRRGLDPLGWHRIGPWLAPCCSRHAHPEPTDPIADALAQLVPHPWPTPGARQAFTDRLAEHVERGRAVLAGETTGTYVRDTRCPACHAEWVTEAGAGGPDRHPALRVNRAKPDPDGTPGPVRGTSCTRCDRRWSWADMLGPGLDDDNKPVPAGRLWAALAADRAAVMAERTRHAERRRAAELEHRGRHAGPTPDLGLPRSAPAGRNRPADRPQPPPPGLPDRDDTAAIRAALAATRDRTAS